jgi:hypothetical protein
MTSALLQVGIALERLQRRSGSASEGGGGLFPQREAAQLPRLPSCRDFFSGAKTLNYFAGIKKSNVDRGNFCWRNREGPRLRLSLSSIYFLRATPGQTAIRKIVAKFPGGRVHDNF